MFCLKLINIINIMFDNYYTKTLSHAYYVCIVSKDQRPFSSWNEYCLAQTKCLHLFMCFLFIHTQVTYKQYRRSQVLCPCVCVLLFSFGGDMRHYFLHVTNTSARVFRWIFL